MKKIGELFLESDHRDRAAQAVKNITAGKKTKTAPSKAALQLVDRAAAMQANPLDTDPCYLARFLIQCTLPHSDPGDVPIWSRRNNLYTLAIQPGWDHHKERSMGYPYGTVPRLLLIWIVTEAKRTQSRRLNLGHSLTEFMREVGLDPNTGGGKRGDAQRLKDSSRRLFAAKVTFYQKIGGEKFEGERYINTDVASQSELWWDTRDPDASILWGSWIELGDKFYEAIMQSVVPCDMRAVMMLKKSPMALDLYMLCNWIGANLKKPKHFISWSMLGEQIGGDYADLDNLKKNIKTTMRKVKLAHPKLNVGYPKEGGGIIIYPSAPAIARIEEKTSE